MGVAESSTEQIVSPGGEHVAELIRPAVPKGRSGGYITYRQGGYALMGCTCGVYAEGPPDGVKQQFDKHTTSEAFQPVDG